MHYVEQKKPDTIKYVWFHWYEVLEKTKLFYNERKQIRGCSELPVETCKGAQGDFLGV